MPPLVSRFNFLNLKFKRLLDLKEGPFRIRKRSEEIALQPQVIYEEALPS